MAGPNFTTPVTIDPGTGFTGSILDALIAGGSKASVDQNGNVFINGSGNFVVSTSSRGLVNTGGTLLLRAAGSSGLYVDNANRVLFVVDGQGKVGIGTAVPGEELEVNGGNILVQASGNNQNLRINQVGSSHKRTEVTFEAQGTRQFELGTDYEVDGTRSFFLYDAVSGAARLYVKPTGEIGIGTTSPGEMLEVSGNIKASGVLKAGDGAVGAPALTFANDPNTGVYRIDADKLGIATAGSLRMTVDASGRVGIGTPTPLTNLQIGDVWTFWDYSGGQRIAFNIAPAEGTGPLTRLVAGPAGLISFNGASTS